MKKFILTLIISTATLFISCKDSGTNPPEDKPGRRDYEWTMDTLETNSDGDYVQFHGMWGSAFNDIWAVATSSKSLWHYDGKQWKNETSVFMSDPCAFFGFSKNDIWRTNSDDEIWHYNGTGWSKHTIFSLEGYSWIPIQDLWGTAPNDIYGVGFASDEYGVTGDHYKGVIIHYNGSKWEFLNIPEIKTSFTRIRRQERSGLFLLDGWTYSHSTGAIYKVYTFDGKDIKEIHSGKNSFTEYHNGEVYIVIDRKIHKYINGKLEVWKDFSNTEMAGSIWFRTEKDFFCISYGGLGHYNGTDYQTLLKFPFWFSGGLIFEKDVYFMVDDINTGVNVFIHGKLKE